MSADKLEVAQRAHHAIAGVPPLEGIRLEVNYKGIYTGVSGGMDWWRVPIIAMPEPKSASAFLEILAEIECLIGEEYDDCYILLFPGESPQTEQTGPD